MNLRSKIWLLTAIFALLGFANQAAADPSGPVYKTPDARKIVEKMINAHGGMDRWRSAPTISYEHAMIDPSAPDDPWVTIEVTEQGSRRCYQTWPRDEAKLGFDGENTWTVGWMRGNPPKMMAGISYFFLNLPWITQDDGVILEKVGTGKLPKQTKDYNIVKMTYDPGTGVSPHEYYLLHIDPDTHLLKGVEYTVTWAALLDAFEMPPDVEYLGPSIKVYNEYADVAGLKITTDYTTFGKDGNVYGLHTVKDLSVSKPFEESRVKVPEGAKIDKSSRSRRSKAQ
ncbi:MAG: hypothetical protein OEN01_13730 [Candidatus Krumholzibacteria bacterium]|nr:hypothetical protein [Candidatus Krumholzibacteria bacterium]